MIHRYKDKIYRDTQKHIDKYAQISYLQQRTAKCFIQRYKGTEIQIQIQRCKGTEIDIIDTQKHR
jgi:hypothetical protein